MLSLKGELKKIIDPTASTPAQTVTSNDKNNNITYVCNGTHHPSLYSDELYLHPSAINWLMDEIPSLLTVNGNNEGKANFKCLARIRHQQPLVACSLSLVGNDNDAGDLVKVSFDKPMRAICEGQIIVLYREMPHSKTCINNNNNNDNADSKRAEEIYYEVLAGSEIYKSGESYMTKMKELPVDLHPSGINDKSVRRRRNSE